MQLQARSQQARCQDCESIGSKITDFFQKKPVDQCRVARRKMRENMGVKGQDAPRQPLSGPKRKVCDSEDDADSGTRRRAARCTEGTAASVYPPHAYASLAQGLSCCGSVRFGGELLLNDPDKVDVTLGSRSPCSSHELLGMRLKQQPQGCSRR